MAETEGFEPSRPFLVCSFSKRVPSATRPRLRLAGIFDSSRCSYALGKPALQGRLLAGLLGCPALGGKLGDKEGMVPLQATLPAGSYRFLVAMAPAFWPSTRKIAVNPGAWLAQGPIVSVNGKA